MAVQLKSGQKTGRNEPCKCGSSLKFKKCHGDVVKIARVNEFANKLMLDLIAEEQEKQNGEKI